MHERYKAHAIILSRSYQREGENVNYYVELMIGDNRQLVTDELVEFEKELGKFKTL